MCTKKDPTKDDFGESGAYLDLSREGPDLQKQVFYLGESIIFKNHEIFIKKVTSQKVMNFELSRAPKSEPKRPPEPHFGAPGNPGILELIHRRLGNPKTLSPGCSNIYIDIDMSFPTPSGTQFRSYLNGVLAWGHIVFK